ncbi:DUF4424 family protein [Azospirillum sp. sgz302134]
MRATAVVLLAALAFGALSGSGSRAVANDSAAAFAAGGLSFQKIDTVRMASEVLSISPTRITVDYVFQNVSGADVTTVVAFPMPRLSMAELYNSPHNLPRDKELNFLDFHTWVDGKEVVPSVEARSYLEDGREITALLKELKLSPVAGDIGTGDTKKRLLEMGAVADQGDDDPFATWVTDVTFHWTQTFPAGRETRIRHSYRPAHGSGFISASMTANWCGDEAFLRAFRKMPRFNETHARETKNDDLAYVEGHWVEYVLKTGANWSGPIGTFTLVVDKEDASLISTCPIPGLSLVRQGNSFTASARDYRPTQDLNILFLYSRCPKNGACLPE